MCHCLCPRRHRRSWRARDRQPQQSVLLRSSFQGSVLLGIKHVSLFCFPFSAGFSHLPNGLYPSYIPLSHLEPPSAGSPLLAQLGQHSLFESQKGESGTLCALPIGHPRVLTLSFGLLWLLELLDAGVLGVKSRICLGWSTRGVSWAEWYQGFGCGSLLEATVCMRQGCLTSYMEECASSSLPWAFLLKTSLKSVLSWIATSCLSLCRTEGVGSL